MPEGVVESCKSGETQDKKELGDEQPAVDDWKAQRDESKAQGDASFRSGDFDTAIQYYSQALSLDPENATLLSNRSAAYLKTSQKSKALHDAQKCVGIGTMGIKGQSRLAAALQSLGRYEHALVTWQQINKEDPNSQVAKKGAQDCTQAIENQKRQQQEAERLERESREKEEACQKEEESKDDEDDMLDDFFNDVEAAASAVAKEKEKVVEEVATDAIKNHKRDLGTAASQINRLLRENYKWRNLNPFFVLDIPHTSSKDDISRRYKALSLLLHPDKNRDQQERAQEAYDEVLKAKAMLDNENKASHVKQLVEQGMKQGKVDWERRDDELKNREVTSSLESFQSKAVQRIFAEVEYRRRDVEKRERNQEQREREQEEDELRKERESRVFDKKWKQEERVEKRIGSWRDFQKKKKSKGGL